MLEDITLTNMFNSATAMLENTGVVVTPTYANWETQSICFRGDTQVKTSDGYKNIENLKRGDMVMTNAGAQPLLSYLRVFLLL